MCYDVIERLGAVGNVAPTRSPGAGAAGLGARNNFPRPRRPASSCQDGPARQGKAPPETQRGYRASVVDAGKDVAIVLKHVIYMAYLS
jgi:hypothetical protein